MPAHSNVCTKLRFGLISLLIPRDSASFDLCIDLSCEGLSPDLENSRVCCDFSLTINGNNISDVPLMRDYILNSVCGIFPKYICDHYHRIFIWDVSLDLTQIEEKIMTILSRNPLFDVPIKIHPIRSGHEFFTATLKGHPLMKWTMEISNKNSVFTLDFIAKILLNKIIKESRLEGVNYFGKYEIDNSISKCLFKRMTFANKLLLMNPKKIPEVKEKFLKKLQDSELNHNINRELRSYFPSPEDYETKGRIWSKY